VFLIGINASENLYSLVEKVKVNGLMSCAYPKHLSTLLPQAENLEDIDALLPWLVKLLES